MPPTWIVPIMISLRDYEMRCPQGKKLKLYRRAKLEKFAHHLQEDGIVARVCAYADREMENLIQTTELYEHRHNKLYKRVEEHTSDSVFEYFHPGRARALKEHHYHASTPGPETIRTMHFYSEARVDCLSKREETPLSMTEHFENREDRLYYRHVEFDKRQKRFGPQSGEVETKEMNARPIKTMTERYNRNQEIPAEDNIAEVTYHCISGEEKITLIYHINDANIAACWREYQIPPDALEKGAVVLMKPENHTSFQVDLDKAVKKNVQVYQLMLELIKAQEICHYRIRDSEDEVREILDSLNEERINPRLDISIYDILRNDRYKTGRREIERKEEEERIRRQEMEIDYLAPFLAKLGNPDVISRQLAFKLKEDCLAELKQRLIVKANLIQARFEKETQELQKKQAWYQQNQLTMKKDDEEQYLDYCSEAMFKIHILEQRLARHKEMAPHKYMALDQKLRADPRLSKHLM